MGPHDEILRRASRLNGWIGEQRLEHFRYSSKHGNAQIPDLLQGSEIAIDLHHRMGRPGMGRLPVNGQAARLERIR